ncbi:MAG: hypothetical protein ACXIUD_16255 [Mongoliitalea sp.]
MNVISYTVVGKFISTNNKSSVKLFFPNYGSFVEINFDITAQKLLDFEGYEFKKEQDIWVDVSKRDKERIENSVNDNFSIEGYSLITIDKDLLTIDDYLEEKIKDSQKEYHKKYFANLGVILIVIVSIDFLFKHLHILTYFFDKTEKWIEDKFIYKIDENSKEGKFIERIGFFTKVNTKFILLKDYQDKKFVVNKESYSFYTNKLKGIFVVLSGLTMLIGLIYVAIEENKPILYLGLPLFVGEFLVLVFLIFFNLGVNLEINTIGIYGKFRGLFLWEDIDTIVIGVDEKNGSSSVYFSKKNNKEIFQISISGLELRDKSIAKIINHFLEKSKENTQNFRQV